MEIDGETFYVVQTPSGDHAVADQEEAIEMLRENGGDIDPEAENVSVVEVAYGDEDWIVAELPWQQIALQLLQG